MPEIMKVHNTALTRCRSNNFELRCAEVNALHLTVRLLADGSQDGSAFLPGAGPAPAVSRREPSDEPPPAQPRDRQLPLTPEDGPITGEAHRQEDPDGSFALLEAVPVQIVCRT